MKCPKCQFDNPEGAKFCNECGYDLERAEALSFEDYKHPHSYTPKFLADKILNKKSAIEGERKLVTVLFADVANYTSITEKLDPEEVHQIMNGCFTILMDEIHKHEGTINQFTGDGVMALFGAPLAHEDHDQRACYAALAIQKALEGYSEELEEKFGLEFKMRIGLNTGSVVVGSIGDDLRMDYTAIGDTTNLASRMQSMAEPGSVLVSKNTYKKVSQYFEFRPLGKIAVKGKEKPLEAYELKGKLYKPQLVLERKIYSEMVGRDRELDRLELQVMKAINGEASIVNIIGEAGIGKSRLVAELKKRDVMKRVTPLEGRAISIGRNLSFHPIINLLKHWARIREDYGDALAFSKLETAIRNVYPEGVDEVVPFVATLMGMKLSGRYAERVKGIEGEALEKLILKNMREFLIKSTELTPLVIVMEDLQWADTSSIELMESLFRLVETQRILFVNVFRPGYRETGDRVMETVKERFTAFYTEIVLQPLDEAVSESLINNMLNIRGLHHGVREQIVQRAGGNPFFIEEVVRSFIDEGVVVVKHGVFDVTEKIDTVVIPQTINDVLMARIDRLEEKTRDLLKVASIIGRTFFYRILVEVTKMIEDIDSRLVYLKEVQLIRERKRMEELEYLFKHGLTQEVTYESILHTKRRELHLKVADSIEKVFSERLHEFYGILAYHYNKGENLEKGEEYLIKAGEEALKSSASSEALEYYQEGLKLYLKKYGDAGDPDKLAMLEKNIALAFFNKGQYANALEYFDRVLERLGERRSKNQITMVCKLISDLLNLITALYLPSRKVKKTPDKKTNEFFNLHYKRSILLVYLDNKRCFIEYLRALKRLNKFDITKIENGVGIWLSTSGLFSWTGISFKVSNRILAYTKDVINNNDYKQLLYYNLFGLLYNFFAGNWRESKEYDRNLVDLNLKTGEIWHVSTYVVFCGFMRIDQGTFREVQTIIRKLSEIGEDYEYETARGYHYALKIKLLMKSRKLYDAQSEADEGISFQRQIGEELRLIYFLGFKATIQILLKDVDGAKKSLSQAKELKLKKGRVIPHFISSYITGQFLFDLYLLEESILSNDNSNISKYQKEAYHSGKKALKNSAKYAPDRTEVFRLMALYYWFSGDQNKAVEWWSKSIEEGEHLGARVELARSYMEIGKRLLERKSRFHELNGIKADEYLEKAQASFKEMDLQWDLDELDKIAAYSQSSSLAI